MSKSFFRKVAFGIPLDQAIPQDPLSWALDQVKQVPPLTWPGDIPTGKKMLDHYAEFVYQDRRVLRKKHKKDRKAYKQAKDQLRYKTGQKFYASQEICIRQHTAIHGEAPVFERLMHFWGNHFAISEKDSMRDFTVGPYHRETIRLNMLGSFENLLKEVTTSWSMIHHLDNSNSIGPNSGKAHKSREGTTINENHARELLELHSVSPAAGYTQDDVIQLTYIMTGWEHPHTKSREECNPVKFNRAKHQRGDHTVLGKTYESSFFSPEERLFKVIHDLAEHPACRQFICTKLCRHFITDYPTPEMIAPLIKAWEDSNGNLSQVYEALLRQVHLYAPQTQKFQSPETWGLQLIKMGGFNWPPDEKVMNYDFKSKPTRKQRRPYQILREIGHPVYSPAQPNGFPEIEEDWLSPELLIRRFGFANVIFKRVNRKIYSQDAIDELIHRNIDDPAQLNESLSHLRNYADRGIALFCSPRILRA